jgi:hypothetical protein
VRYRIEYLQRDRWSVIDQRNQCVFSGTYHQVEDWLDYQDNALGRPAVVAAPLLTGPRLAADTERREPDRRQRAAL